MFAVKVVVDLHAAEIDELGALGTRRAETREDILTLCPK